MPTSTATQHRPGTTCDPGHDAHAGATRAGDLCVPVTPAAAGAAERLATRLGLDVPATLALAGRVLRHRLTSGTGARPGGEEPDGIDPDRGPAVQPADDGTAVVGAENGRTVVRLHLGTRSAVRVCARDAGGHLERLLVAFAADPARPVREPDLLTDAERTLVVERFNATTRPYPRDRGIPALFAEQVAAGPGRVAVVDRGTPVTDRELDRRSARLAAVLRDHGVRPGDIVGLLLPRGADAVAATVAILRAGAAYLPLDPGHPAGRTAFLIADSGATVVLTDAPHAPALPPGVRAVLVTDPAQAPGRDADPDAADTEVRPADLAYVMYTSGTTGRPKGVRVTHRNVVRLVRGAGYVDLTPDTCVLATGAPTFDASTFETWGPLLNGGRLCLVDDDVVLDAARLGAALAEHAVTTLWLTAPLFARLTDRDPTILRPLRTLLTGGDVVSPAHVATALAANPGLRVVNGYGPTENTTFSTAHPVPAGHPGPIPIGRPITNSTAYVVDPDGRPQPVGVPGELWVGGDGVADGYLGRDDLTARAFLADPFRPGGRVYRTGDVARWRPDGTLDFLGRIDHQVKIRGFRVELGEIEARLRSHPDVTDAAVAVHTRESTGDRYLCGYVTSEWEVDIRELRGHLATALPTHLMPSYLVQLDALPLNRNGKLDRAALPEPTADLVVGTGGEYLAPGDEVERRLVALWERVLGVAPIGVTDDFYELGADSLTATRLAAEVGAEFGVECPVRAVLTEPTVRRLAGLVRAATPAATHGIPPA
ncbi:MAG TPA: non-ribosomal peptide synthetase, partial [Micromonospora sp.]